MGFYLLVLQFDLFTVKIQSNKQRRKLGSFCHNISLPLGKKTKPNVLAAAQHWINICGNILRYFNSVKKMKAPCLHSWSGVLNSVQSKKLSESDRRVQTLKPKFPHSLRHWGTPGRCRCLRTLRCLWPRAWRAGPCATANAPSWQLLPERNLCDNGEHALGWYLPGRTSRSRRDF